MPEEFRFRALTEVDFDVRDNPDLIVSGGLRLKEGKKVGCFTSKPLDSGISADTEPSGCRWHRIVIDADIPENSTLSVSFYTSEDVSISSESWSGAIVFKNAGDALVQVSPGRYITLKIDFRREGEDTPVLRQLKIYYQRLSYLRYLPAVYQENRESKDFLERFLSIFESALYDSEETISRIPAYFDPEAAPKDFVPWLASWLSLDLYDLLDEEKKREFILRGVEFYKQKGTMSGIASLVTFLTGKQCCVKEYMNNVFRSYGMEHYEADETTDERDCIKFYHKVSGTVKTTDSDLMTKMGTYYDEVHYVIDTSETGRYSPHTIGLFIFLSSDTSKEFRINKDELFKIINSFLPVFVRVEIIIVDDIEEVYQTGRIDEYRDRIHATTEEQSRAMTGVYEDRSNWERLYSYGSIHNGVTNNLSYRTVHIKIGVELMF